ncbi:putative pentatricopeptide repeat-containing protein At1g26500 [Carex rostrata]
MDLLLTECGIGPTQSLVVSIIDRFRNAHKPAYRFFRWAGSVPGFAHGPVTSDCVFEEMQVAGCDPSAVTYTCLLTRFGNAGRMDRVISLLSQMEESGPAPDLHTYKAVMKLLTSHDMPEEANRVYKSMVQRGFESSISTYNMFMKSLFSRNHEMGSRVWEVMSKKGVSPNANSYTVFIAGHIQHGRVREAERYILEMVNKGMKAPLIDYNKFVADFCWAGEPNKLEEMAQKMNPMSRDMYFLQKLLKLRGDDGFAMNEVLVELGTVCASGLRSTPFCFFQLAKGKF